MRLVPDNRNQRWLAVGNLVNMTGTGATMSALVVFLAVVKRFPLAQATWLLAAAGLVGVLGALPLGQLSDRFGARAMAITTELVCAAATLLLLPADSAWWCALCLAVRQLATSSNTAARATLMGGLVPSAQRAALRAYQRSVSNAGFSVGALLSGLALADGSTAALYTLLGLDAATYCFGAYATARLPGTGRGARRRGLVREALAAPGSLTAGLLNAAHTVNRSVVSIGVPLWVVYGSHLPHWAVSAAMITNTVTVVLLQVPLSGRAGDLAGCGRSLLWAGGLTGLGCAALALAGGHRPAAVVWPLFAVACVALAFGEILGAAAGWTLSYDLAPERQLGHYQAVWQFLADGAGKVAGPVAVGWAIAGGPVGWAAMAVGFTALAASGPPLVGWSATRSGPEAESRSDDRQLLPSE